MHAVESSPVTDWPVLIIPPYDPVDYLYPHIRYGEISIDGCRFSPDVVLTVPERPGSSSSVEVVQTYHQYLATMECLTSGEAKRRWRKAIKDAWDNRCCFCGNPPISDKSLTIDHMKPKSKGGEDISRNCLPACLKHNQSKGSSDWKPWFREQDFYDVRREARIIFWLENSRLPTEQELEVEVSKLAHHE